MSCAVRLLCCCAVAIGATAAAQAGQAAGRDSPVGRAAPPLPCDVRARPTSHREAVPADRWLGRVVLVVGLAADDATRARAHAALQPPGTRGDDVVRVGVVAVPAGQPPATAFEPLPFAEHHAIDRGGRAAAAYGAAGAPWFALIDRRGVLRWVGGADADGAELERRVVALRREPTNPLVGQPLGELPGVTWPEADAEADAEDGAEDGAEDDADAEAGLGAHELVLLRWWTDGCPFCRSSLPDLDRLAGRYGGRGLGLVAVYHPKRPDPPDAAALRRYLDGLGVTHAALAVDAEWRALRDLMRRGDLDAATSVSFLVDRRGRVRWVHPGPRLHASPDGRQPQAAADLLALERLIDGLLPPAATAPGDGDDR